MGDRHVVPNSEGGWDVKAPGADQVSAHLETQSEAVDRAREIILNDGGGQLTVHKTDGEIRENVTVDG